jgi:hypothetical protein
MSLFVDFVGLVIYAIFFTSVSFRKEPYHFIHETFVVLVGFCVIQIVCVSLGGQGFLTPFSVSTAHMRNVISTQKMVLLACSQVFIFYSLVSFLRCYTC